MRKTRIDGFELKEGTREDAPIIHHFVKELATYEKMLDQFTGSVEEMAVNLFDKKGAEAFVLYYEGNPIGYCLFFKSFSTFLCKTGIYLEDVYVDPNYRNKGLGKEVFYQLALIAKENDYKRVEWVCLDWNEPSIRFYEDVIGANAQKEWLRFQLDEKGINKLINK